MGLHKTPQGCTRLTRLASHSPHLDELDGATQREGEHTQLACELICRSERHLRTRGSSGRHVKRDGVRRASAKISPALLRIQRGARAFDTSQAHVTDKGQHERLVKQMDERLLRLRLHRVCDPEDEIAEVPQQVP